MRSPHVQSYRAGATNKIKPIVPDVAPPCCCYTDCEEADDTERRATEAAAAAAVVHRAATTAHHRRRAALLHWCCLCVCMCLCMACGWSGAEAAPLTQRHAADAAHTSNFWTAANGPIDHAPLVPAAAHYLINSAQSAEPIEAAASKQVATSAGAPVPPASSTPAVSDADIAEFTQHYHISSQKQLKATMAALQRAYTRSRRADVSKSGVSKAGEEEEHAVSVCEESPAENLSDADKKSLSDGKYALVPIVFVTTLGASLTPWYLGRLDRAIDFISFGACLSAGVILGAGFSHLAPDADEAWNTYFCLSGNTAVKSDYPWTGLVAIGVLLLLITIDSALLRSGLEGGHGHGDGHGHAHGGNGGQGHSHAVPQLPAHYDPTGEKKRKREAAEAAAASTTAAKTLDSPATKAAAPTTDANGIVHFHSAAPECAISIPKDSPNNTSASSSPVSNAAVAAAPCEDECESGLPASQSYIMASAIVVSGGGAPEFARAASPKSYGALEDVEDGETCSDRNHVHSHKSEEGSTGDATAVVPAEGAQPSIESIRGSKRAIGQAYVFFIALSVHSIFDGLSIGVEQELSGFYALLFAVGGHKLLDGFALGVPVFFARLPRAHTIFALVFCALCTPIGIVIGMVSTEQVSGVQGSLSKAIILSMSFGSFVFISIVELLPAGLNDGRHLLSKMFVTALGWGAMVLIAIWV